MLKPSIKVRVLAAALAAALCAATALAADPGDPVQAGDEAGQAQSQAQAEAQQPPEGQKPEETSAEASGQEEDTPEKDTSGQAQRTPDPEGTISFSNLEDRLREHNLNLLALEENIAALEVMDYEAMTDDLRSKINYNVGILWDLTIAGQGDTYIAASLQQAYDSMYAQFEDLRDGKLQEDNEAIIRQLRSAQDQVVMTAQSLYVALVGLEQSDAALDRTLAALDRTVEELELRYELGQISALTLQQTKSSRTTAVSGKQTLEMNIANYKTQLELLLGEELTGTIALQPLPQVTAGQLEEMDLEADLEHAKQVSYQLFAAQRTLEDAKESARELAKQGTEDTYYYKSAQHQRQAAEYTYEATVDSFELSFRTLYSQVKDYWQILSAAQTALACQQDTYASMELKYEQGSLSYNKLLDAADQLSAAQDTVDSARVDLFSAYNSYRWAVDYGILN